MTSLPLKRGKTFATLWLMSENPLRQVWRFLSNVGKMNRALAQYQTTVKPGEIRVIGLNQWVRVHNHEICVAGYDDRLIDKFRINFDTTTHKKGPKIVLDEGVTLSPPPNPNDPRVLFVEVIYRNPHADKQIEGRRNQWWLYDEDGYSYEAQGSNRWLYENNGKPFLGGTRYLSPGTKVRGWVAFELPREAVPERLQFVDGFLSGNTADFWLFDGDETKLNDENIR